MAHYTNETRIDNMEIDMVGFDPEKGMAHLLFKLRAKTKGESVYISQNLTIPLELLNSATELVNKLAVELQESGNTEFELRYEYEFSEVS